MRTMGCRSWRPSAATIKSITEPIQTKEIALAIGERSLKPVVKPAFHIYDGVANKGKCIGPRSQLVLPAKTKCD